MGRYSCCTCIINLNTSDTLCCADNIFKQNGLDMSELDEITSFLSILHILYKCAFQSKNELNFDQRFFLRPALKNRTIYIYFTKRILKKIQRKHLGKNNIFVFMLCIHSLGFFRLLFSCRTPLQKKIHFDYMQSNNKEND